MTETADVCNLLGVESGFKILFSVASVKLKNETSQSQSFPFITDSPFACEITGFDQIRCLVTDGHRLFR
jgi:hypothetical protein